MLLDALLMLQNGTLPSGQSLYYSIKYTFERKDSNYGNVDGYYGA